MNKILQGYKKIDLNFLGGASSGVLWLMFAQFSSMLFAFVSTLFLSKLLSKADFAIYKFALSLYPFFVFFSLSGASTLMLKKAASDKEGVVDTLLHVRLFVLALALPVIALFAYFSLSFFNLPFTFSFWIAMALLFALSDIFYSYSFYLRAKESFKEFAKYEVVGKFALNLTVVFLAFLKFPVPVLILVYGAVLLLLRIVFYFKIFSLQGFSMRFMPDKKDLIFSSNMSFALLVGALLAGVDKWIVIKNFGQESLSDYIMASLVPMSLSSLFVSASSVVFPKFVRMRMRDKEDFFKLLKKFSSVFTLGIFIFLSYALLAPALFDILFNNYRSSCVLSIFIAGLIPLYLFAALTRQLLIAKNDRTHIIKINLISTAILLAVFYIIKDGLHIYALPVAMAASLVFTSLAELWVSYRSVA